MRTGVVVAAQPGAEDLAVRAEELRLHSFWAYDTPMVHGDPFVDPNYLGRVAPQDRDPTLIDPATEMAQLAKLL
jgi:hypothetical protein